jgi:hypothetical protein
MRARFVILMNLLVKEKAERKTIYLSSLLGVRGWLLVMLIGFGALLSVTHKPLEVTSPSTFSLKEEERQTLLFTLDKLAFQNPAFREKAKVAIESLYSGDSKAWEEFATKRFFEMDSVAQQQALAVWLKSLPSSDQNLAIKSKN